MIFNSLSNQERVKFGGYYSILEAIGNILRGTAIPIALGIFGGVSQPWAYFYMTLVLSLFLLIITIPHIFATREPKEMIELRAQLDEEGKSTSSFKDIMGRALKDKNYVSFLIAYLASVIQITCVVVGIYYYVVDGLGLPVEIIVWTNLTYLAVYFISIPFWVKITKKLGARKAFLYALMFGVILAPFYLFFAWSFLPLLLIGMLGGIASGGVGVVFTAAYSEAIDNATVQSGKREETSYVGLLRFMSATAILWQVLIFLIVATITGYNPNIDYDYSKGIVPSQAARIGLNMQISVIPAGITLIAGLIYYKYNEITKEVALENKKKLLEMGL